MCFHHLKTRQRVWVLAKWWKAYGYPSRGTTGPTTRYMGTSRTVDELGKRDFVIAMDLNCCAFHWVPSPITLFKIFWPRKNACGHQVRIAEETCVTKYSSVVRSESNLVPTTTPEVVPSPLHPPATSSSNLRMSQLLHLR
ncbi:hypothetical protein PILCRDRAFT_817588 [Piloderma croceum F 1598]|uniref:Uncharacterized protein n=1 Tax=Piloderma croceum (strain F 1598) TaxID=765440 RepID=A0A0C3FYQ6_PILCF|nr:hypothetical protein PILCRDRAFT_817588 [Piloderma croceum F 1598]